ncbi:UNKNOWN [Stylonychia lemnae]|uniref:Uncharacterized protein n=1 Tax=Stylonychia lemnae TaxID=5949 RepID=A0A078AM11_STYLE|nr:UNKNOWN [Stylonychia lemnae]|eukprot:CDW82452.1 UNKNOWN [Stylonychia lemnae]
MYLESIHSQSKVFDKLDDEDFFGLITLHDGVFKNNDLQLEKKRFNKIIKKTYMNSFQTKFISFDSDSSKSSLHAALDLAISQQLQIERMQTHNFEGPQRWIIAIVNDNIDKRDLKACFKRIKRYNQKKLNNPIESKIKLIIIGFDIQNENLIKKFEKLCDLTVQGCFINLQCLPDLDFSYNESRRFSLSSNLRRNSLQSLVGRGNYIDPVTKDQVKSKLKFVLKKIELYKKEQLPLIFEQFDFN